MPTAGMRHTSEQTQYIALEHALFAYYNEGFGVDRYFLEDGPFVNIELF